MALHSSAAGRNNAFSLVELSIVLVILGLLVGGVLAGKSLIKASELRSVTQDFQKYHAAVMTFKDKYFYYPGDLPNATVIWGVVGGDGTGLDAACTNMVSTDAKTCNGTGDGIINIYGETYRLFQHLANAGLVEGQYAGAPDSAAFGPSFFTPGFNIAKGRIPNSGYMIGWAHINGRAAKFGTVAGQQYQFSGLHIDLIKPLTADGGATNDAQSFWGALSNEDAWNVDSKMDDGVAATGKVRADSTRGPGFNVVPGQTCLTYNFANTTDNCVLGYIFGQ